MKIQLRQILKINLAIFFVIGISQILSAQNINTDTTSLTKEKPGTNLNTEQKINNTTVEKSKQDEKLIPVVTERSYTEEELKAIREKKSQPDLSKGVYKFEENNTIQLREPEKIETNESDKTVKPKL